MVDSAEGVVVRNLIIHILGAVDECAQDFLHVRAGTVADVTGIFRPLALYELENFLATMERVNIVKTIERVTMAGVDDSHKILMPESEYTLSVVHFPDCNRGDEPR